jgi:transaldolase / glucose-6-phosphate isomerase
MTSLDSAATTAATANPLLALGVHGQSIWLDYIRRGLIESGELTRLIESDGLNGVTSNPAIFEKAIAESEDYRDVLRALRGTGLAPKAVYEALAISDIQDAADRFAAVYRETDARDGYVSLEVAPDLAQDTAATLDEARRLWQQVARPNVMIKVPATAAGLPAIETLIAEGINVNVTLLFAQDAYARVAEAYLRGLEARRAAGGALARVASVASFFVSRIDAAIDAELDALAARAADPAQRAAIEGLRGRAAIANAKLAYQHYLGLVATPRWQALARAGAQPQRLLWASTSTKNPRYRDVLYVEELVGRDTVNTLPPATLDAFRDHGRVRASLVEDIAGARATLDALAAHGVSLERTTDRLLVEGVQLFADAFAKLLRAVAAKT